MKTLTAIVILAIIGLIVFAVLYPTARYKAGYEHGINIMSRPSAVYIYHDTIKMQGKAKFIHDTTYLPIPHDTTVMTITECVDLLSDCEEDLWNKSQPISEILIDSVGGIHNITYIPNEMMFFEDFQYTTRDSIRTVYINPSSLPYYVAGAAVILTALTLIFK